MFYIKGYENQESVGIITDHNTWDGKRPVDQFDWIEFLTNDEYKRGVYKMKERIQWIYEAKGIGIFAFDFIP